MGVLISDGSDEPNDAPVTDAIIGRLKETFMNFDWNCACGECTAKRIKFIAAILFLLLLLGSGKVFKLL